MRKLLKGALFGITVLAILAIPAVAAESSKGSCTATSGSNVITYDCNYVAKNYEMGSVLPLQLDYSCSVRCGGVLAFGLSGPGYTPKGEVEGQIVSVERSAGSMVFSLQFAKLHESGGGTCNGTAFMTMLLNVDDGSGRFRPMALPFKVHVNSNGGSSGSN